MPPVHAVFPAVEWWNVMHGRRRRMRRWVDWIFQWPPLLRVRMRRWVDRTFHHTTPLQARRWVHRIFHQITLVLRMCETAEEWRMRLTRRWLMKSMRAFLAKNLAVTIPPAHWTRSRGVYNAGRRSKQSIPGRQAMRLNIVSIFPLPLPNLLTHCYHVPASLSLLENPQSSCLQAASLRESPTHPNSRTLLVRSPRPRPGLVKSQAHRQARRQ